MLRKNMIKGNLYNDLGEVAIYHDKCPLSGRAIVSYPYLPHLGRVKIWTTNPIAFKGA